MRKALYKILLIAVSIYVLLCEDIGFDNLGLSKAEFTQVGELVKRELELEDYTVTAEMVDFAAFRYRVQMPGLLFHHGLNGHKEPSILIQLNTKPQRSDYEPEPWVLSRWDVRQNIVRTAE